MKERLRQEELRRQQQEEKISDKEKYSTKNISKNMNRGNKNPGITTPKRV